MQTAPQPPGQLIRMLRFAAYLLRMSGRRSYAALGFLVLGSLTEGLSILLLVPILQLVGSRDGSLEVVLPSFGLVEPFGEEIRLSLGAILCGLVAVVFLQSLFTRFKNIYMADLLQRFASGLRLAAFEKVARAPWRKIARLRGSDLHHLLTTIADRVHAAAFQTLLLIQDCVLLCGYLAISFVISPMMTAFAFLSGAAMLAALHPVRRRAESYGRLLIENNQAQARVVSEFLTGLKVAKSFNAEPAYLDEHARTLMTIDRAHRRFVRSSSIGGVLFQTSTALFLAIFTYASLRWFALTLPEIVVLVFLFLRIAPRFMALQGGVQEILTNLPALDAMRAVEAQYAGEETLGMTGPAPWLNREIRLYHVCFRYAPESPAEALADVSLVVPAGRITALIGPSGSGKTTIADVLMGLIDPDSGSVRVDGIALDDANKRAWRAHVAYVPQEVFLLNGTIEANLRLAAPEATDAEMWAALRSAQAEAFVRRLPLALQSVVGDRGGQMSGGERQRIALARALLRRPRLLILDEATSALDRESQSAIAAAIQALRGSMTIVSISHRTEMIAFADHVIAFADGRVVEAGPYDDLKQRPGLRSP